MSQFSPAIDGVLNNESGTPIENDNGRGLSVWGITWETAHALQPDWTEETLRNLTRGQAATFYYMHFWLPSNIGLIDDQALANKALDLCVNLGQGMAVQLLQTACGVAPVDGVIGPLTAAGVNRLNPSFALINLRSHVAQYYKNIAVRNPSLAPYLDGWLNRLQRP